MKHAQRVVNGTLRAHDDQLPIDELLRLILPQDAHLDHPKDGLGAEAPAGRIGGKAHGRTVDDGIEPNKGALADGPRAPASTGRSQPLAAVWLFWSAATK